MEPGQDALSFKSTLRSNRQVQPPAPKAGEATAKSLSIVNTAKEEKVDDVTSKSPTPGSSTMASTAEDSLLARKTEIASRGGGSSSRNTSEKCEDDPEVLETKPPVLNSAPGSYAIEGPGQMETSPSEEDTTTHNEDTGGDMEGGNSPGLFEAEVVGSAELQVEREEIRKATIQELQASTSMAEVVDDTAERKQRRLVFGVLSCITVASIIGVVVAVAVLFTRDDDPEIIQIPTLAPTTKFDVVEDTVERLFGDGFLDDDDSPKSEAVEWMSVNDTILTYPVVSEEEEAKFRQRFAMCILSFATNFETWLNNARWLDPIDECKWSGLTCDVDGRLVGISLVDVNLTGTLPTELGVLTDLKYLFVHENPGLTGTIPDYFANMTSLVSFYGHNNAFEGTLPSEFGQLGKLVDLNLSGNGLVGVLPASVSRMIELVELDLSSNRLGGSIPFQLWRLQRLETLLLHGNNFSGTIATDMGAMAKLERVELQNNFLVGAIPTHLGNLLHLDTFRAFDNLLSGDVPNSLCELREDAPFDGLHVLETDCLSRMNCSCCTRCL